MPQTPIRAAAAIAAAALALPPAAPASRPGNLAMRSVSAPAGVTAGMPAAVTAVVARTGRTGSAAVRFYLSADGRRNRGDVRLPAAGRVPAGGAFAALRVSAQPEIPARQASGTYRLIACADDPDHLRETAERDNCRAAPRPLRITAAPVGTRQLVAAAVAAGRLSPQQGLVYRVLAAVGDARLPAAYAGDDAEPEHLVLREALAAWPGLSPAQRARIQPHFTPPAAQAGRATAGPAARAAGPGAQPACVTAQLADRNWRTIAQPGGHVRLWWLKADEARVGPRARSLAAEVENVIWPSLRAVMGREPLSDARERCFHGIDGKLDIYLARLDRGRALTVAYPPRCSASPAFVVFDAASRPPDRWEVAHELMHAFQFAFRTSGPCESTGNWDEATATWAAQHVYPRDDGEHRYPWFLRDPGAALPGQSYEGWVFPYALEQMHGAGTIGAIYRQTERAPLLAAIDAGVPGGLEAAWPEFARLAWNQDPVDPTFRQWDRFAQVPEADGQPIDAERIDPGAAGEQEIDVPIGLAPLTRSYRRFAFGPGITQLTVEKPGYAGLHVQALLRLRDGSTKTEDWSRRQPVLCPEAPGEQVADLVLIISNSSRSQPLSDFVPLRLLATNLGCHRYTGEASGTYTVRTQTESRDESWTATGLSYERFLPSAEVPRFLFQLTGGTVTWSTSGQSNGCAVAAGPVTLAVRPDGQGGALDMWSAIRNGRRRSYYASGFALPPALGTMRCRSGTFTRYFIPHGFLSTSSQGIDLRAVEADGSLRGTESRDEGTGGHATYAWHLAPG